jgi:hypothetical protein
VHRPEIGLNVGSHEQLPDAQFQLRFFLTLQKAPILIDYQLFAINITNNCCAIVAHFCATYRAHFWNYELERF